MGDLRVEDRARAAESHCTVDERGTLVVEVQTLVVGAGEARVGGHAGVWERLEAKGFRTVGRGNEMVALVCSAMEQTQEGARCCTAGSPEAKAAASGDELDRSLRVELRLRAGARLGGEFASFVLHGRLLQLLPRLPNPAASGCVDTALYIAG